MSYLDWKVGDRVVCVNDNWTVRFFVNGVEAHLPNRQPMIGEVLTIVEIEAGCGEFGSGRDDGVYLAFGEIPIDQCDETTSFQIRWDSSHFRKVEPRKTEISIFTAMLHGLHDKVPA